MSKSSVDPHSKETASVVDQLCRVNEAATGPLLAALEDPRCREIFTQLKPQFLSTSELADRCGLPSSTAYRKLDVLDRAGLVDSRVRVYGSEGHPTVYVRAVDHVVVSFDDETVEVRVVPAD